MRFEMRGRRLIELARKLVLFCDGISTIVGLFAGPWAFFRRTHACDPIKALLAIHRLDSANSVCSCAVFLANPR